MNWRENNTKKKLKILVVFICYQKVKEPWQMLEIGRCFVEIKFIFIIIICR